MGQGYDEVQPRGLPIKVKTSCVRFAMTTNLRCLSCKRGAVSTRTRQQRFNNSNLSAFTSFAYSCAVPCVLCHHQLYVSRDAVERIVVLYQSNRYSSVRPRNARTSQRWRFSCSLHLLRERVCFVGIGGFRVVFGLPP